MSVEFIVPETLVIKNTKETQDLFIEKLESLSNTAVLNASQVTKIDTAGLQLLISFHNEMISKKVTLEWKLSKYLETLFKKLNIDL